MNRKTSTILVSMLAIGAGPTIWFNLPDSHPRLSKSEEQFRAWVADAQKTTVTYDLTVVDQPENIDPPRLMGLSVSFYGPFEGDIGKLNPEQQSKVNNRQNQLIFAYGEIPGRDKREIPTSKADELLNHDWTPLLRVVEDFQKINPNAVSPDAIKAVIPKPVGMMPQISPGFQLAYARHRGARG